MEGELELYHGIGVYRGEASDMGERAAERDQLVWEFIYGGPGI